MSKEDDRIEEERQQWLASIRRQAAKKVRNRNNPASAMGPCPKPWPNEIDDANSVRSK